MVSWNCQRLKVNQMAMEEMCKVSDVILRQKICLKDFEGNFIHNIEERFSGNFFGGGPK